jgi:nucleoside-diphosphate-sugar epimerase
VDTPRERSSESFLVTGGTGCIGAWVIRALVREGVPVTVVTAHRRLDRLRLVLSADELAHVNLVDGDIADVTALESAARNARANRLVHLAGMQLPLCAADPLEGSRVNVSGTVAVFEAARRLGIGPVVYASSAAVYGPASMYSHEIVTDEDPLHPTSHYGVYKVANEQGARVWWENEHVPSVGLRPHSAYGPGRDQGVTSKPTVAMIAAAAGRPYRIGFSGRYQFQFAEDVAEAFIRAARLPAEGAAVYNIGGSLFGIDQIIETIEAVAPGSAGKVTAENATMPFPAGFDGGALQTAIGAIAETPLEEGVRRTVECYRAALGDGRMGPTDLDRILG